ncbi:ribbon-helix-helix protein, CopG family [Sphingopyxis sp. SE2]|uniref:ribbon-helix-helix protein, CopG family n=1 Tax=Sphingopyxis sp. SE2 TaxID=1586240 RepID=UPI00391CF2A0
MTGHVKQTFRLDAELVRLMSERAQQRRLTRTEIVEAALASLLTPDHDERLEAMVTRRLDRMTRQLDRIEWQSELVSETLALLVRHWLTNSPPLPDAALSAAQAVGKRRWEAFVAALARRMEGGPKLATELSRDLGDHSDPPSK